MLGEHHVSSALCSCSSGHGRILDEQLHSDAHAAVTFRQATPCLARQRAAFSKAAAGWAKLDRQYDGPCPRCIHGSSTSWTHLAHAQPPRTHAHYTPSAPHLLCRCEPSIRISLTLNPWSSPSQGLWDRSFLIGAHRRGREGRIGGRLLQV